MTKVNLSLVSWHNNDGDEGDGPWLYQGTTDGYVDRVYLSYNDFDYSYRGVETDLTPPFFVVYAEYHTGSTFGSDIEADIVGIVKTSEEALGLKLEAEEFTGFGELSNGYYVPWNGYFESLQKIGVERLA